MEKETKKAFFQELWKLDEDSEGSEGKTEATLMLERCPPPIDKKRGHSKTRRIHSSHVTYSLPRSKSVPTPPSPALAKGLVCEAVSYSRRKPNEDLIGLKEHRNAPGRLRPEHLSRDSLRMAKKRKRDEPVKVLPEAKQIFKGLRFFFLPNNDIDPARRMRIRKAREWGALWMPEWDDSVTHIIVDRSLTGKDLEKYFEGKSLSDDAAVVNERYPSDCLQYGFLIDANPALHHIPGWREEAPKITLTGGALTGPRSLELKPDKWQDQPLRQAPSPAKSKSTVSPFDSNARSELDPNISPLKSTSSAPTVSPVDELSSVIEEVKALGDLPIDLEESAGNTEAEVDSSDDDEKRKAMIMSKTGSKSSWQKNFSCMSKHDGDFLTKNPNGRTIEVLQQMLSYYEQTKDQWRAIGYRKAISALKKQNHKILTADEAFTIPSIGRRLADKIEEIVWTDKLQRLESTKLEANDEALRLFLKIYGVGYVQASKWIGQGHRSLDDLRQKAHLTRTQQIGIDHIDDFETRIPRQEVDQHAQYIRKVFQKLEPSLQFTVGGSYRRGASDSGDIDYIVTKADCSLEQLQTIMTATIIPYLFRKGYLKAKLAGTATLEGRSWHGAATLPGSVIWRRIDFLLVPWEEMGAALIYFTGNDIFNRSIRLLASKKGMRLNERGLWKDVIRGKNRERLTQGTLVEGTDERRIFELLDVPWRPPEHRLC